MENRALCSSLSISLPVIIAGLVSITENNSVFAQLNPDNTLGAENSLVTPQQLRDLIQGGAIRGNSLFHSFEDFNVGEIREVFFDLQNNTDILNIFTRVTGSNSSNILGTLGVLNDALNSNVLGDANLFLLNPNGISFGANANLQLNGSFFATTADGFVFDDDFTFSASAQEAPPPLLTISILRFLSFRENSGNIINQSIAQNVGLQVPAEETLGLIGGEVQFLGGGVVAPDARVEIGAVGDNSLVSLRETNTGYVLGYEGVEAFKDISLTESATFPRSAIITSGEGGGNIQLQGRNINVSDSSLIFANTDGSLIGGGILINSEQLTIGEGSAVTADVSLFALGKGGDITINTSSLFVQEGALISARSNSIFGGNGGNLTINVSDSVQVIGNLLTQKIQGDGGNLTINTSSLIVQDGAQVSATNSGTEDGVNFIVNASDSVQVIGANTVLSAQTLFIGNAGDIIITTPELLIRDGGRVSASTFGEGNAGNLTINASDSVQVIGTSSDGTQLSRIASQVNDEFSTGNAGNLTINTSNLLVQDGAQVSSSTFGSGNGGNLNINASDSVRLTSTLVNSEFPTGLASQAATNSTGDAGDLTVTTSNLLIQGEAQISAGTLGAGNGGNIKVNATDTILIEGNRSGIISSTGRNSTGSAGSITIDPTQVTLRDGGLVSVESQGIGTAGDLTIISDNLTLDNGRVTASTSNANGGNIILSIAELLRLRNGNGNPLISANAGGEGNGGNLTINTTFFVAFPGENSDITANASRSNAGRIVITAEGILGLEVQDQLTNQNDITAFSEQDPNLNGQIIFNTPQTSHQHETTEEPEQVADDSDLVSQSVCSDFGGSNQLVNSGRGGVPQIPGFIVRNDVVDVDLVDEVLPAPPAEAIKPRHRTTVTLINSEGEEFKPAMGAVLLPNGMVEFVDYNPVEVYRDMYAAVGCNQLSNQ